MSIRQLNSNEIECVSGGGLSFLFKFWNLPALMAEYTITTAIKNFPETSPVETNNDSIGDPWGSSTGPGISINPNIGSSNYSSYSPGTYQSYTPPETTVESEEWVEDDE